MIPFMGMGADHLAENCVGELENEKTATFCGDDGTRNRIFA